MTSEQPGRLRRALSRLTSSTEQLEAEELQQDSAQRGAISVHDLEDRTRVQVCGTLRTVTLRPRAGVPALEAELYDGSGSMSVVWLGRRRIPGIEPGRSLTVQGLVTVREGDGVTMFNPRYQLHPSSR